MEARLAARMGQGPMGCPLTRGLSGCDRSIMVACLGPSDTTGADIRKAVEQAVDSGQLATFILANRLIQIEDVGGVDADGTPLQCFCAGLCGPLTSELQQHAVERASELGIVVAS